VLALGSLLWWIGRDDSLNQTLQRVAGWLPADQTLVAKEVTGSVKNGGRIGWLQWQSPTMKVEVREAQIGWQFRPLLLSRTLKLGEVHIAELRIASTPDPDKPASEPLQSLTLPVKIELPFRSIRSSGKARLKPWCRTSAVAMNTRAQTMNSKSAACALPRAPTRPS
jgi:translocation and assembly module TamB